MKICHAQSGHSWSGCESRLNNKANSVIDGGVWLGDIIFHLHEVFVHGSFAIARSRNKRLGRIRRSTTATAIRFRGGSRFGAANAQRISQHQSQQRRAHAMYPRTHSGDRTRRTAKSNLRPVKFLKGLAIGLSTAHHLRTDDWENSCGEDAGG